jgi:hypothetical protein
MGRRTPVIESPQPISVAWRARHESLACPQWRDLLRGRLFARGIPDLPSIFAREAREALELGERRARAAAMIEAAELTGADVGPDPEDLR